MIATFGSTAVILFFGEITPKIAAAQFSERVALWVAPLIRLVVAILDPFVTVITRTSRWTLKHLGFHLKERSPLITEEEIRLMIEVGKDEGVLGERERSMLHKIFEFGDTKVGEVMVPRKEMAVISEEANHERVLDIFVEEGHTRIPIHRAGDPDKIIGVIHAHDVLNVLHDQALVKVTDIIRPIYTVAPEQRVEELLQDFQKKHIEIAVIVDSQGDALGMATPEDLIEEIVGEIH